MINTAAMICRKQMEKGDVPGSMLMAVRNEKDTDENYYDDCTCNRMCFIYHWFDGYARYPLLHHCSD